MDKVNESYVTPELMSELDGILDDKAEVAELFDDFTQDLLDTAPVTIKVTKSNEDKGAVDREVYLKDRRRHPSVSLPDSVEA